MKRNYKILPFFSFFFLALVGCTIEGFGSDVNVNLTELPIPTVNEYDVTSNKISWNSVSNCDGYTIKINTAETNLEALYFIPSFPSSQSFTFSIKARGKSLYTSDSPWSETQTYYFVVLDSEPYSNYDDLGTVTDGSYSQFKNINVEASYLGYGYDVINDPYIFKDYINMSAPIIDLEKIESARLKMIKENWGGVQEYEGSSMEDFSQGYSASLQVYGKYGKCFSGGINAEYKGSKETKTFYYFYKYVYAVRTFNLYLTNSVDELQGFLSDDFKTDLLEMTPETLFNKYGTHLIKEVSMGGRLEINSQYSSTISGYTNEASLAVNAHMKFLKDSVNVEASGSYEDKLSQENIVTQNDAKQFGGKLVDLSSPESRKESYSTWLSSFDEDLSYSALAGIVGENSLVGLWDLVPDSYVERKEELETKFLEIANEKYLALCDSFKLNTSRDLTVGIIGQGTVLGNQSPYSDGETVSLSAVPSSGNRFVGWYSGDTLLSEKNDYSFVIHTNLSINAKFEEVEGVYFTVGVAIEGNGIVTGNETNYLLNTQVELTAIPNRGYSFEGWYQDSVIISSDTIYTFTISSNTNLTARFIVNGDFTERKLEKTTFMATIKCESTVIGNPIEFSMIGLPVMYNNEFYLYGNANFSGNIGGRRFNDVARLSLNDVSTDVLFGGSLSFCGSAWDNNESGTTGWDPAYPHGAAIVSYMMEDPSKDFAGDKNISISISGICIKYAKQSEEGKNYPEIGTAEFYANLYTESTSQSRIKFKVYGVKTSFNGNEYLYGTAYFFGSIDGSSFYDVDSMSLRNTTAEIMMGGTLYFRGDPAYSNESGASTSYHVGSDSTTVNYVNEDPRKDFAGNDINALMINGICVKTSSEIVSERTVPFESSSLNFSIKTESTYQSYVSFTLVGISVFNGTSKCILGSAIYDGLLPSGKRFDDVANITFTLDSANFVFAGLVGYCGNQNDNNENGIAFATTQTLGNSMEFSLEDPTKDFAGNENNRIILNGVCVQL